MPITLTYLGVAEYDLYNTGLYTNIDLGNKLWWDSDISQIRQI